MTPFHPKEGEQIPPTQAVWQVFEVVMNAWILITMITVGFTLPLVVWTVFEVFMNFWILLTMLKIGVKKK